MSNGRNLQKLNYLDEVSIIDEASMDIEDGLVDYYSDEDQNEDGVYPIDMNKRNKNTINKSDLEGENYDYVNFKKRQMAFTNVTSCHFRHANLDSINFIGANIHFTDFEGAKLTNADFEYAELVRCNFGSSDISQSNFRGARLKSCDFRWADLRGVDFSDCVLQDCNFKQAVIDDETLLPFSREKLLKWGVVFAEERLTDAG